MPARKQLSSGPKRGAVPVWLAGGLFAVTCAWIAGGLNESVEQAGFARVDPSRVAFERPGGLDGIPEEWAEILAGRLAELGELSTLEDDLGARIAEEVAYLPFIHEVGEVRVLWPDGVTVEIRLREPVACVRIGTDFSPVSADGVILPGYWAGPPDFGQGLLPLIGPNEGTFDWCLPGDLIEEAHHLDALSVAVSMREHLSPGDFEALGPVLIDARRAAQTSVGEPGVRLRLEGSRDVFFGRAPRADEPGELPAARKWSHLMAAVELLYGNEASDWDRVDVRWDVPALRPRYVVQ